MKYLFCLVAFVLMSSCTTPYQNVGHKKLTAQGIVKVWPDWIKSKYDKYDINMNFESDSTDKVALIFVGDIGCKRGDEAGRLKSETDQRVIDIRPHEKRQIVFTCVVPQSPGQTRSDYVFEFRKIYDNPNKDGRTPGKVLVENAVWRQADDGPSAY